MSGGFQITRLRVEQLRRFRQPLELTAFEPGLNILAGPNEAGKSTLVRAIRAAFFERHRSTAVDDLRPWGEGSSAAPQIELDFTLDGEAHRLVKSFLGKKRCTLQIGARTLDSTDAEEHLAQLFGFAFAGKGASKPEHWGIPGLLWVEQGAGQDLDVSHARDHLNAALQGQAGASASALAATGGDELLELLRGQRGELLTSTGRPRGVHAEAAEAMAELRGQLEEMDGQIATYRDQVDQLSVLRHQHAVDEAAKPWEGLRRDLESAEQRQSSLRTTQDQLQADQVRLGQLEETRALLIKELETLEGQQAQAKKREQELARAVQQLQAADSAVASARAQSEAASRRAQGAREALASARQEATRRALEQQLEQARAEATQCAQNMQRAEEAQQRLFALRDSAAAAPTMTKAQVEQLVKLERAERDADLRRQAVATRLQFTLPEGQSLDLQTQGEFHRLQAQGERLLDAPATLKLPSGGELVITPGGEDLSRLARTHHEAQQALQAALQALGVSDLVEAQARLTAVSDRDAQIQLAQQALAIVAPDGLEPLRSAVSTNQARIRTAQEALARLPEPAAQPALLLEQAELEHEAAQAAEQAAAAAMAHAQSLQAGAQGLHQAALREHAAAQAALSDPTRAQRQAHAQQQLLANGAEHQALAARMAVAAELVREARPDILAQDIDRLRRSIDQLSRGHQQRREQILLLENTLQQAGAQGLEEQREALAGKLGQAERRHAELQRRAAALDLLCRKIDEKREATLARLQAPLSDRLHHYLPLLMPGATVQMDAGLAPGTIARTLASGAIEAGQVQDLSFGAREQLGVISRFAYADLLRQAGRPTLLILDDTLVHSDADRLAQMKRVLFDAAQRHQVLLFTCHPEKWRDMGVAVRTLADGLKVPAVLVPQQPGHGARGEPQTLEVG
ncbi:DNA repair exonuclease SbcCD ATPase subunit [Variovorax sp. CF079]|uniref:AAA family ATPase n=1 Tax=Variovorax sp. CF079 TaxID=1882774 RepID=UPI00088D3E9C|nr:AAA family ATPase [Variovorax sp. CF079]SDC45459.1 DNA repair exonuclease SbcCD ATPase subunit [Variovorax sp. CF079]